MVTTIIIPVSRPDFLKRIFAQLELLDCDRDQTNILVYVDGDIKLYEIAHTLTVSSKFNERLCLFRHKGLPNVGSITRRRQRIADIHNELKEIIGQCDTILLIEDDTLIPLNTIRKMQSTLAMNPHLGFVTGLQVGRWGYEHLGVWSVDDVYDPKRIQSLEVDPTQPMRSIDAAGLYCCMMKRETYLKHTFKPFEDVLGPDVDFGIALRREGYENVADFTIHCKHLTKRGEITVQNANIMQVEFIKREKWDMIAHVTVNVKVQ